MACSPAAVAWVGLGNGLSPICNLITSLPAALSRRATARTSKAVSATRPRAKELRVTGPGALIRGGSWGGGVVRWWRGGLSGPTTSRTGLLLGRDRLGQGSDHGGDDVRIDQLLAEAALVAVRLGELLERLAAPVLAHRE